VGHFCRFVLVIQYSNEREFVFTRIFQTPTT
jgi:hypothetical protein